MFCILNIHLMHHYEQLLLITQLFTTVQNMWTLAGKGPHMAFNNEHNPYRLVCQKRP